MKRWIRLISHILDRTSDRLLKWMKMMMKWRMRMRMNVTVTSGFDGKKR
jgi:hypothetical protein